ALPLQPRRLGHPPSVAHRLVSRRVGPDLGAVDRRQSQTAPARRPCEPPRLPQHPREVLPVPQPETVDRAEVRDRSVSCEVAKREVAPQPPRDLPFPVRLLRGSETRGCAAAAARSPARCRLLRRGVQRLSESGRSTRSSLPPSRRSG